MDESESSRMMLRRKILGGLGAVAGSSLLGSCAAPRAPIEDHPCPQLAGKKIRWIVPNAAGGGFDTESRLIEPFFEKELGAEIVIENVPGAGGILGARAIMSAAPDGLTLGIMNIPGLMVAALMGASEAPNPARDFAVLGRVSRSWHVWAVAANSRFRTLEDLIAEGERRALIFAITELGTTSFVSSSVSSSLLGVNYEMVPGFTGVRGVSLAVLRGEVDCVCHNFDTILDLVEAGDLRLLLQVSAAPIAAHPSLDGVPLLGGASGWATRRAQARGLDATAASETAQALIDLISAGRLVVAPRGLDEPLARCLEQSLHRVLTSGELRAAAKTALDVAEAGIARADLEAAVGRAGRLVPVFEEAIRKSRG